jgi:iron complex outermembrane recepter protein
VRRSPHYASRHASRTACGSFLAAFAQLARAEETPEPRDVIRIEVTGTNIPRVEGETALPLQIITREEIVRSGSTTVAEVMARVSANVLGYNDQISISDQLGRPGMSSVNLRGIGDGSTLILLNGRRVANYAFDGTAVDVNSIPLAAVDRIEILKDGASAIYGTDAIAGVVNFILRKNYRGFDVDALGAWTEHGGGDQYQVNLSAGYGDLASDRFNVFVTASYQKDQALSAAARPFSRTGYIPAEGIQLLELPTFPANIYSEEVQRFFSPALASGCAPPASLPTTNPFPSGENDAVCGFDAARFRDLVPPVERTALFGRTTFQIGANHQLFAEAGYSHNEFVLRTDPTRVSEFQANDGLPLIYPAGGPYYPTAFAEANGISGDLSLLYRTLPLGVRIHSVDTSAWRGVIGMEGVARDWDYSAALSYSRTEETERFDAGDISLARLRTAMATGLINPFGPSGPEGDALLAATQVTGDMQHAKGSTLELEAKASKAVYRLPAGPLAIAFGAEARREELEDQYAPFVTSGDISQETDLQSAAGSRSVQALFVEASIPIARGLEAQVAARYDHYSDFGSTVNPKLALRWQPAKSLLLRASWGTGFRAPPLYDLYTPLSHIFIFPHSDPVRCPVTKSPRDCQVGSAVIGGNPALRPETSTQFNAGIVWEPALGLSLAADYWKIAKDDTFGGIDDFTLFQNFAHFESTNIVRGPVDAAFPDLPGPIQTVRLQEQNVGRLRTSGIDVDVKWRGPEMPFGRLGFMFDGTYFIQWKLQGDGLNYGSALGVGAFPRWKHHATLDWTFGAWGATLGQTYQTGYEDSNVDRAGNPLPRERRVAGYEIWDLDTRYTGFKNFTLAFGVRNLMDRAPPFTNLQRLPVGYDPAYADPRGRMFYTRITYAFK